MKDNDALFNKVTSKTNVTKDDILGLANQLQNKNLNNEADIKSFIGQVAKMANKNLSEQKMDQLVDLIKKNKVPKDINKMM